MRAASSGCQPHTDKKTGTPGSTTTSHSNGIVPPVSRCTHSSRYIRHRTYHGGTGLQHTAAGLAVDSTTPCAASVTTKSILQSLNLDLAPNPSAHRQEPNVLCTCLVTTAHSWHTLCTPWSQLQQKRALHLQPKTPLHYKACTHAANTALQQRTAVASSCTAQHCNNWKATAAQEAIGKPRPGP
jgi:hypothetical protein